MSSIRQTSRFSIPIPHDSDFSLSNIPFGVFSPPHTRKISSLQSVQREPIVKHICTRIGDHVLDLNPLASVIGEKCQPPLTNFEQGTLREPVLNSFAGLGRQAVTRLRRAIRDFLEDENDNDWKQLDNTFVYHIRDVQMCLSFDIGDYTDFYAGIHHARYVGRLFRGAGNELQRNYLHLPVGYHGRASTVFVSGNEVRRPMGQLPPAAESEVPRYGNSEKMDYELELAAFIGVGNPDGRPIEIGKAAESIFGLVLMNDWSARDIQSWEYVPLGPFLGKSFATTISPWVVTWDALEPFFVTNENLARPEGAPELLSYLVEPKNTRSVLDLKLDVYITPSQLIEEAPKGRDEPTSFESVNNRRPLTTTSPRNLVFTFPQMIAHHTVNGCALRTGDLLGSGTISGPDIHKEAGSLLELSANGTKDVDILVETDMGKKTSYNRRWLEDGDEVVFRGYGILTESGERVGFGECQGRVVKGWD